MTIEQFLRGCFDCGYEAAVILTACGDWRISVYEGRNTFESRYRAAEGRSFEAALAAFEAEGWGPSSKEAIANALAAGCWEPQP